MTIAPEPDPAAPVAGPVTARAAVWLGTGRGLAIEDVIVDPPCPGEVGVRMLASGVCHSDLHILDDEWAPPAPLVMGHEGAGIVEMLGPGVGDAARDPKVGDLVVLAWTAPCGTCLACARGDGFLCERPLGGGHRGGNADVRVRRPDGTPLSVFCGIGTMASYQVVNARAAVPVTPAIGAAPAALIGCAITTGVGAVRWTAGLTAGETAIVIGLGGVGLSVVMGAALSGAARIVAVDREADKLEMARRLGATDVVHAGEGDAILAAVRDLLPGGADHVFEAIGLVATVELAFGMARRGGTVTLVGMTPAGHRASFDVYQFVVDGGRVLGSNYGSAVPATAFPLLATLAADGRLPVEQLITEHITLDLLPEAFEAMRRRDGARRVIVF